MRLLNIINIEKSLEELIESKPEFFFDGVNCANLVESY